MNHITTSPINGKPLKEFLICNDHLVTKKQFRVLIDTETELLVTSPQPSVENIGAYYESEEYNSHADSDGATSIFDKVYEFVKSINLKSKYSIINKNFNTAGNILDIGCGAGDFLNFCKNKNWEVSGVEPTEKARLISEKKLGVNISTDLSLNSFADNSFDVVTMWHVLEHRFDVMETVAHLKRIAKPGGLIIIALPNYKSYDAKYYKQYWGAFDVPRHLFHFSKKTIEIILSKNNLNLTKVHPMWFDSFYVSMISEKNKTGKMNPIKAVFIGLISNIKAIYTKEASSLIYEVKNK
ncbi:MAG: class I SAM-dependent methyltransferase [Ichthyobacteriaceae bacterium]|nr:class I SAM-dependent methyltransferase [Ichthyobacteriaceae bacterium]